MFSSARNAWAFKQTLTTKKTKHSQPFQIVRGTHPCSIWLFKAEVVFSLKVFLFLKKSVSFVLRILHIILDQLLIGRYPVLQTDQNHPKSDIWKPCDDDTPVVIPLFYFSQSASVSHQSPYTNTLSQITTWQPHSFILCPAKACLSQKGECLSNICLQKNNSTVLHHKRQDREEVMAAQSPVLILLFQVALVKDVVSQEALPFIQLGVIPVLL